jgi:predicted GIY-YIG superfamily endonuclease
MTIRQPCARWGCEKSGTYDKPLCRPDWQQWDAWGLEECARCHWFYVEYEFTGSFRPPELTLRYPDFCGQCTYLVLVETGKVAINPRDPPEDRQIVSHAHIQREVRYVYILKLSDGTFYIGQTNDLVIRLQEHKDGAQRQTKGKHPRLVYYESFEGNREDVDEREDELTQMNQRWGSRRLRQIIERFRVPLRLLDLEA